MNVVQIGVTRAQARILDQVLNIAFGEWAKTEVNDAADINQLHLKVLNAANLFRVADQLEKDAAALREVAVAEGVRAGKEDDDLRRDTSDLLAACEKLIMAYEIENSRMADEAVELIQAAIAKARGLK